MELQCLGASLHASRGYQGPTLVVVEQEIPTTEALLDAWRDTSRAAELAGRLADLAVEASELAVHERDGASQVAALAGKAAIAAEHVAQVARAAAERAVREVGGGPHRMLDDWQIGADEADEAEAAS
jgi:hypothetical protein